LQRRSCGVRAFRSRLVLIEYATNGKITLRVWIAAESLRPPRIPLPIVSMIEYATKGKTGEVWIAAENSRPSQRISLEPFFGFVCQKRKDRGMWIAAENLRPSQRISLDLLRARYVPLKESWEAAWIAAENLRPSLRISLEPFLLHP
jgi:hypothetical protein